MASSCNCPITLKERKKKQTNKRTTNKQTNKNKTICASQSLLQPGCCLMSGTKLHKAQSLKFFFFFYSETFSLVLMQKTCFYFCYAVTTRSFWNRESRDQSSSGLHTQFLLIIINNLLILSSCHFTGSGRTYQLFLL